MASVSPPFSLIACTLLWVLIGSYFVCLFWLASFVVCRSLSSYPWSTGEDSREHEERARSISWSGQVELQYHLRSCSMIVWSREVINSLLPLEWLVSNFSFQYHPRITHWGHENKGDNNKTKEAMESYDKNRSCALSMEWSLFSKWCASCITLGFAISKVPCLVWWHIKKDTDVLDVVERTIVNICVER